MPRILPHRRRRPVSNVRSRVAGRSRYPAARTLGERASGREPMSGRRKWLGLFGGLAVVLAAIAAGAVVPAGPGDGGGGGGALRGVRREHDGQRLRRLPIAVVREKLEHGKEAQREKISGPRRRRSTSARSRGPSSPPPRRATPARRSSTSPRRAWRIPSSSSARSCHASL